LYFFALKSINFLYILRDFILLVIEKIKIDFKSF